MKHTISILLTLLALLPQPVLGQSGKLSPYVREAAAWWGSAAGGGSGHAPRVSGGPLRAGEARPSQRRVPLLTAFVRSTDAAALAEGGCRVLASWGTLHIAAIPLDRLSSLAARPEVLRVEAGRPCRALLDTTATVVRAVPLWRRAPLPLTGRGVVVGLVDIGFDLTHPTFATADGTASRVAMFWDQLLQPLAPQPSDSVPPCSLDAPIVFHGTHTASTAAGNGSEGAGIGSAYCGMAPDATLALVSNFTGDNESLVPDSLRYLYTTATDVLAFKHIFDWAASRHQPCVVNMSEGSRDDFYEGSLACEALDSLTGPGRIIVASAGNEAWRYTYLRKTAADASAGAVLTLSGGQSLTYLRTAAPPAIAVTFRAREPSPASPRPLSATSAAPLTRLDINTAARAQDSVYADTLCVTGREVLVLTATYPACYDAARCATEVAVVSADGSELPLDVALTVEGGDGEAEMFGYFEREACPDATGPRLTHDHNILFPASAPSVIAVGGTAWRQGYVNANGAWMYFDTGSCGERMSYSSCGPTLSGTVKPDVCAPGANVVAAGSSFFAEANPTEWKRNWDVRRFTHGGREYSWASESGTSMSAPVVTGIVAQWLQLCPTLTPGQLREVFAATCRRPDGSLPYPNNSYGWGEIDAEAGAEYISRNITGISQPRLPAASAPRYNVAGQRVAPSFRGIVVSGGAKRLAR